MTRSFSWIARFAILCSIIAHGGVTGHLGADEPSLDDRAILVKVAAKFFEVAPPVEGWAWPPLVGIVDTNVVNAFAGVQVIEDGDKPTVKNHPVIYWVDVPFSPVLSEESVENVKRPQPYMIFHQAFFDRIVKGREIYLAETFGHELGHILLRHVDNYGSGDAPLVSFAKTRQEEAAADLLGMKLALKADYPYEDLIKAVQAWRAEGNQSSSIKALGESHPGWTDRATLIDEKQSKLWSSISSFENGVYFLMAENYTLAERCFSQVAKEFPRCYEAWANRGYCRLMRYCDGLEPDDLKELALNHVVVGGFYQRAGSIESRGVNEELWFDAVGDLRESLRLKPDLILPKANLALAYLVHPNGKQLGKAVELFEQVTEALKQEKNQEEISPLDKVALLVNAGVTEFANGDAKAAHQFFEKARSFYLSTMKSPPSGPIQSAMLYSQAFQMANSSESADRQMAKQQFEEYLKTTSSAVAWWSLAYDQYQQLCQTEHIEPKAKNILAQPLNLRFRPVVSLKLGDAATIALNDPVESLTEKIGEGVKSTVVRRTNIHRRKYEDSGVELLCSDRLLAIRIRHAKSPPLVLQASGPGGETLEVQIGMPFSELSTLLAGEGTAWDRRYGTQDTIVYHYFTRLGFGVRLDEDNNVLEIIIAQIPYEAIVK